MSLAQIDWVCFFATICLVGYGLFVFLYVYGDEVGCVGVESELRNVRQCLAV